MCTCVFLVKKSNVNPLSLSRLTHPLTHSHMLAHAHVRVFLVKRNVNVISPFKRVNTHENSPFTHTDACTHTYTYTYTYSLARTHCYILGSNSNILLPTYLYIYTYIHIQPCAHTRWVPNALVPTMWIMSMSYTV